MDKNLVLEDNEGRVVRVFNWNGEQAKVIRRSDTKRLEITDQVEFFFDNNIDFEEIGQVSGDAFTPATGNNKEQKLKLGNYGQLSLVPAVTAHQKNLKNEEEKNKAWLLSLLLVFLLFLIGAYVASIAPATTPKIEEELKQEVVKIVKNIKATPPPKPVQVSQEKIQPAQNKIAPSKIAGLKRMGALSVLGSLNSGKNKGGLDISAAQSSAGPGMGGGTQGSGGVQTSLYAKGIVGAALGAGQNVNGGGGYGTKGKGGGQAGYGKLALTGSTGATPIPLGQESNVSSGLDRDQIAAVIMRNNGQVTFCYNQGLSQDAGLSGRVAIAFVIGGNGLVKSAKVDSTTLNSKAVEDCIVMRLKTWKFPIPEGGVDVDVQFPFKLARTGQG